MAGNSQIHVVVEFYEHVNLSVLWFYDKKIKNKFYEFYDFSARDHFTCPLGNSEWWWIGNFVFKIGIYLYDTPVCIIINTSIAIKYIYIYV